MININKYPIFDNQLQNVGFKITNPLKTDDYITFGNKYISNDGFASQSVTQKIFSKYCNEKEIIKLVNSNSRLKELLTQYNLPIRINMKEFDKLRKGHLAQTRVLVSKIYSQLPKELKSEINQTEVQQAATLHDFGKILIPDAILNKSESLNADEREIMQLHSEIGYELLKNCNLLSKNTLNMIKYHHQTPSNTGYPCISNEYDCAKADVQLLNVADKYSALTEKRSYKEAYTPKEALEILKHDRDNGEIMPEIYEALQKCVQQKIV